MKKHIISIILAGCILLLSQINFNDSIVHAQTPGDSSDRIACNNDSGLALMDSDGNIIKQFNGYGEEPVWSPDGKKIAFKIRPDGPELLEVINTDGTSIILLEAEGKPSWSPDSNKIVYSKNYQIYVVDLDTGTSTQLTDDALRTNIVPVWSPNGNKIAYISHGLGFDQEIYIMDADGTDQTPLTNDTRIDANPAWSPDGTKIAYTSWHGVYGEIYVMDANGNNQIRLTNNSAHDLRPVWSPDGAKIAFTSDRDSNSEIYVMNPDGLNQVNLTNNPDHPDYSISWSPDSKRIAFVSEPYEWWNNYKEIYVMDADGSNRKRLTYEGGYNPAWSPALIEQPTPEIFSSQSHFPKWIDVGITNAEGKECHNWDGKIAHVETVDFKDYVIRVLRQEWAGEDVGEWHEEALKAGAMAVKHFALYQMNLGKKTKENYDGEEVFYDILDNTCDQVYPDDEMLLQQPDKGHSDAVNDTWDEVMKRINHDTSLVQSPHQKTCAAPCLSQLGTQEDAVGDPENDVLGKDWQEILTKYYGPGGGEGVTELVFHPQQFFEIGDHVTVISNVNARKDPSELPGDERVVTIGAKGRIKQGPVQVKRGDFYYTWWQIEWEGIYDDDDNKLTRWSADGYYILESSEYTSVTSISDVSSGQNEFVSLGNLNFTFSSNQQAGTLSVTYYPGSPPNPGNFIFLNGYWDITASMPNGTFSAEVTFPYTDEQVSEAEISEQDLNVFYSDDGGQTWLEANSIGKDTEAHTFTIQTDHFSLWAIGAFVATNQPPTITLLEPDGVGDSAETSFTITWTDDDPDNDAGISLYYDTDNSGEDGTLIVDGISEDDETDQHLWNTTNIADGEYYIYAVIDDDVNAPVVAYSDGPVTIVTIPPEPTPTPTENPIPEPTTFFLLSLGLLGLFALGLRMWRKKR